MSPPHILGAHAQSIGAVTQGGYGFLEYKFGPNRKLLGAAYAISSTWAAERIANLEDSLTDDLPGESSGSGRWANFYWHLRYALAQRMAPLDPGASLVSLRDVRRVYVERLSWDENGLKAVRDL